MVVCFSFLAEAPKTPSVVGNSKLRLCASAPLGEILRFVLRRGDEFDFVDL